MSWFSNKNSYRFDSSEEYNDIINGNPRCLITMMFVARERKKTSPIFEHAILDTIKSNDMEGIRKIMKYTIDHLFINWHKIIDAVITYKASKIFKHIVDSLETSTQCIHIVNVIICIDNLVMFRYIFPKITQPTSVAKSCIKCGSFKCFHYLMTKRKISWNSPPCTLVGSLLTFKVLYCLEPKSFINMGYILNKTKINTKKYIYA